MKLQFDPNQTFQLEAIASVVDIFAGRRKLNKDQKTEAQTVLVDAMKESAPLRQQLAQGRAAIANAILGDKSADDLKKIMDAYTSVIAQETGIDSQRLRSGKLNEGEWPLFTHAIVT